MTSDPFVAQRPAYILSKMTGTFMFQLIALDVPPEKMQIVSMHPGIVYADAWKALDVPPERFDSGKMPPQLLQLNFNPVMNIY